MAGDTRLSNFLKVQDEKGKDMIIPKTMKEIAVQLQNILQKLGHNIYRLDNQPFGLVTGKEIATFSGASDLFGWLGTKGVQSLWVTKGLGMATKEEFVKYLASALPRFDAISDLPHIPPIKEVFYLLDNKRKEKSVNYLAKLVDMWTPANPLDRDLILAMFCTPFWGGKPGRRPSFFIEADDEDNGRGVGKTTLADTVADLAGGYIDCQISDDLDGVKKRMLKGGSTERIVRFDNVKSNRLSSSGIEGIITAPYISGHRMYKGETKIPNLYTYLFTMNDSNLSTDMCQRSIRVKLKRNEYTPSWLADLDELLSKHRQDIIDEICTLLRKTSPKSIEAIRFSAWQNGVLNKINPSRNMLELIKSRQTEVDADEDDAEMIREYFAGKLEAYHHSVGTKGSTRGNLEKYAYYISRPVAHIWLKEMLSDRRLSAQNATRKITRAKMFEPRVLSGGRRFWYIQGAVCRWNGGWIVDTEDKYKELQFHKVKSEDPEAETPTGD